MKLLFSPGWLWAGLVCSTLLTSSATGKENSDIVREMLQGLRERQYFDYALVYLDQLAAKTDLPAELRQEIPYEKAMVLLDSSKAQRLPEKQLEQLDQAQSFLEQFVKDAPNHPRAGDANSQRAEILIGKARVEIVQSRNPANQETRGEFQKRARDLIVQARSVFETAQQQHEAAWNAFGKFINQEKDPEQFEAREQALMQLISAMLNVCLCRYEEAQTYDAGTPESKKTLNQAAEEFEKLHQRYRNYTGGLYARLYEGKCFDDQGDTQKAMGIYNELLEHEGSNKNLKKLQHKTLQFKMEALNRKVPPDSQVVVDLANEWLKGHKAESLSQVGLAIQWEQAVGLEGLGDQRDIPKADRERYWRAARSLAQKINRFRSIYSDVSLAMIQRLDGKLGGRDRKPDSFETAQGLANQHFRAIQELRKELYPSDPALRKGKTPEEIKKLEQELQTEMHDATEMYQLALNLADKHDDPKAISTARLYYAYVHFWARRNYDAAILGEFVSRTAPKDESTLAIDSAYLAMAAFVQAFNDTKGSLENKQADLEFVIRACEFIIKRWPESDRANDARMRAGAMYALAKKPVEAAKWYGQVPEADQRYAEAQLAAGQAFWDGYRAVLREPADERPPKEQYQEWQPTAERHLRTGIAKMTASAPTEGLPPPELMGAKFSLADILISQAKEAEAIVVLTGDPHSVIKAVTVEDESKRPAKGVQKREFAVEVYKLLLRAYIGNGKLDEARDTMKKLETIAGGAAGADITDLYVGLGKLLKDELERIQSANETDRFNSLRASFETFLNDVYQRKEGQTFGSLTWVGETYAALGQSDAGNASSAMAFYEKAANAFKEIVQQTESNPNFATPDQLLAIKVRLLHALRMKKEYAAAEKLATELLKQRKDDLKLQIETALLYQDWAAEPGEEKKYLFSINGNSENLALGFAPLSKRVLSVMRGGRKAEFFETYLDTRYNSAFSRYNYGLAQKAPKEKIEELNKAEVELLAFASVTKDVPDEIRDKFNSLFRKVREAIGDPTKHPVEDLKWTGDLVMNTKPDPESEKETKPKPEAEKAEKKAKEQPPKKPEGGGDLVTILVVGVGVLVMLGIVAMMFLKKKPPQPLRQAAEPASLSFDFAGPAAPATPAAPPKPKPTVAAGPPREKKVASTGKPAAAAPSAAAPTATKSPPAKQPSAKPKPKPPPAS